MAKRQTIRRAKGQSDVAFMERAADAALAIGGSVDAGMGPICPGCAPSSSPDGDVAEILPWQSCYNCGYGETK